MKHFFTLLTLFGMMSLLWAQEPLPVQHPGWDLPTFDDNFIALHQLKSVHIRSSGTSPMRGGGSYAFESGKYLAFDAEGKLLRYAEIERGDTSLIQDYDYSESDKLNWVYREDRIWNKRYKTGYRFNRDETVYQQKSYELLNNDESMLLDTRYYTYDQSRVKSVRTLGRNRVRQTHLYDYNPRGLLTQERFLDPDGRVERSIEYSYDAADRLKLRVERSSDYIGEYRYLYGPTGRLERILRLENGQEKGLVTYLYDGNGKVVEMRRITHSTSDKDEVVEVLTFDYQTY